MWNDVRARHFRNSSKHSIFVLGAAGILALGATLPAFAHNPSAVKNRKLETCPTATFFNAKLSKNFHAPYNEQAVLKSLLTSPVGKSILPNLWVNARQAKPCFAMSDTPIWGKVVSRIPADIVALEVSSDLGHVLVYTTGLPDYKMETPKLFSGFKPGNIYGVYKFSAEPKPDTRPVHEFGSKGAVGLFVNGVSIFNYSDTFSYQDKGAFAYNANVAEAAIVNSDIAHATPSNLPQFPKSRGIFHNHQMSNELLQQLRDPYWRGVREHSKVVGYAIDSYPIYGPLGYSSKDKSSGIKTLKSSYLQRSWLEMSKGGTGHRSSMPEWAVRNWDRSNDSSDKILNLFQKTKDEILYRDTGTGGPVLYAGEDAKLAAEIKFFNQSNKLKRDTQGYVYWEASVRGASGKNTLVRNYLLKASDLWGPDIGQEVLPVSFQIADQDKFLFKAVTGAFAEDHEFIAGYGDLDFFNGIESFVPEQGRAVYHYVATFGADVSHRKRMSAASFPYFIGIQYRGVVDPLNATLDEKEKAKYLTDNRSRYKAVFDLGVTGKTDDGGLHSGSVIETWRKTLSGE